MSHCHDEHSGHAGDHHGAHDHSDEIVPATQTLLYEQIDFGAVTTLNESEPRSGAKLLQKTWTDRLIPEPELMSDADEQLLMTIPYVDALLFPSNERFFFYVGRRFAGQVRLHSIILRTSDSPSAPKTMKVYVNRDDLDFVTTGELEPAQTFELAQTSEIQEHPVKRVKFNTTRTLAIFFEDNFGSGEEDVTRISYLGFKGEFMKLSKEPVSFLYEAAANPADHKAIAGIKDSVGGQVGHGR